MSAQINFESFHFEGQHEGERVLFWCRENMVGFLWRASIRLGLALAVVAVCELVLWHYGSAEFGLELPDLKLFFVSALTSVFFIYALWLWTLWALTIFIITDHRLIKIVPPTPFTSFSTGVKLLRVQDVTYSYKTFVHSLFNFGDLTARSASGSEEPFYIRNVSNPRDINHYLHKLIAMLEDAHVHRKSRPTLPVFVIGKKGERWPVSNDDVLRDPSLRRHFKATVPTEEAVTNSSEQTSKQGSQETAQNG